MLKRILKILSGLILGLVVLVVVAVIYYQFDDDLNPDVIKVLNHPPKMIEVSKNGYYPLLGLYAAKDSKPVDYALAIIDQAKKQYQEDNNIAVLSVSDLVKSREINISAKNDYLCYALNNVCLELVKKHKTLIAKILKDNSLIIQRFRKTYRFNEFQETPYLLGFEGMLKAHHLVLTDIAFQWLNGNKDIALDNLSKDLEFWRMVTRGDISLITRMIAVAMVSNNLNLWSEVVTDCRGCELIDAKMTAINQPLTAAELSLRKVFAIEYRYMYALSEKAMQEEIDRSITSKIVHSLFFKKNNTLNKIRTVHEDIIDLSECDFSHYHECDDRYMAKMLETPDYLSWEFIDNPVGSILAAIAQPAYTGYARIYFEQEVKRRLIIVKHRIYKNKIKLSSIQTYLNSLSPELRNPFDGSAIKWDMDSQTLMMTAGEDSRIKVSIAL
jgi:hypothetical protein